MRVEMNHDTGRLSITIATAGISQAFARLGLSEPGDVALLRMVNGGEVVAEPLDSDGLIKSVAAHVRRHAPPEEGEDKHAQTERITQEIREPAVRETPIRVDEPEDTSE
jgi:hypothetical protein